jgi:hypothetical protein
MMLTADDRDWGEVFDPRGTYQNGTGSLEVGMALHRSINSVR